jgi:CDP-glycerol glycerophosphotransferase (TagB/SpsB family)
MKRLLRQLLVRSAAPVWWLLGWIVPKDARGVVIHAFPDFDDSTRALVEALRGTDAKLTILTTDRAPGRPAWLNDSDATVVHRYTVGGVLRYHRASWVLFTHGCFSAWRPSGRQVVVNVWHGMPIKRIGLLDGKKGDELPRFHFTIASDRRFQTIMANAFGVEEARVLVTDHPRMDILRGGGEGRNLALPPHERLAVWLPTYRASVTGDVRVDGAEEASIFAGGVDLARIDDVFARHGVLCLVKPHPMARVAQTAFAGCRAIRFVDDRRLAEEGVSLYELLAQADLLVTDVSSVYFDYKELERPIVLYCPDLRSYATTRGFVAPIETLVDDPVVETEDGLIARLEAVFSTPMRSEAPLSQRRSAVEDLFQKLGAPPWHHTRRPAARTRS